MWVPIYWVITWYRTLAGGVLVPSGDELLGHLGKDKAGDLLMVAVRGHESEKWALSFWEDSRRLRGRAEVAYWHQVINRDGFMLDSESPQSANSWLQVPLLTQNVNL